MNLVVMAKDAVTVQADGARVPSTGSRLRVPHADDSRTGHPDKAIKDTVAARERVN
jgi:hypothetical protein